ncbi:hypothetical protein AAG906_031496 [Vitis piasezkii]
MKRRERDHHHGNTALRKGTWSEEEDRLLREYVDKYGQGNWKHITSKIGIKLRDLNLIMAGLRRCRKSCRLRWLNYLRPDIKRGSFGVDEDDLIIRLHRLLGNRHVVNGLLGFRWTLIAGRIPGRTSNDIKNYWNTYLSKKIQSEADKSAALVKHNTCTSAVHSETLGSEFETCSEQKQGDEEEEDTVSFWRRLLLEGEYRELDLRVKNKEILQVEHEEEDDDDLFQGLDDLLHGVDILDSFA